MQSSVIDILAKFTPEELAKVHEVLSLFNINVKDVKIKEVVVRQTTKGIEKYGQTIIDCPQDAYDWQEMILEEIVDAYVYKLKSEKIL